MSRAANIPESIIPVLLPMVIVERPGFFLALFTRSGIFANSIWETVRTTKRGLNTDDLRHAHMALRCSEHWSERLQVELDGLFTSATTREARWGFK